MKKIIMIICIMSCFIVGNVNAKEQIYYTNSNGVTFTKEEYDFLNNIYFEGYINYMTKEDYNNFISSNIMSKKIKISTTDNQIVPFAEGSYSSPKKTVKIASACSNTCTIIITAEWKTSPVTRSYDNIGAYLDGTSLIRHAKTLVYSESESASYSLLKKEKNGIAATIMLPRNGTKISLIQELEVTKSGKITASYQHVTSNISLANSQKYSFSKNGYGGVFLFQNSIKSYYDAMRGVTISLS